MILELTRTSFFLMKKAQLCYNYALCHDEPNMPKFMLAESAQAYTAICCSAAPALSKFFNLISTHIHLTIVFTGCLFSYYNPLSQLTCEAL